MCTGCVSVPSVIVSDSDQKSLERKWLSISLVPVQLPTAVFSPFFLKISRWLYVPPVRKFVFSSALDPALTTFINGT